MAARLNAETLARGGPRRAVIQPAVGWHRLGHGIIHLGIGAFHRAHQAVFTQDACAATGDDRWGIVGVTQRSAAVKDQLGPQDGLYGVLERSSDTTRVTIVGQVRKVIFPQEEAAALWQCFADPDAQVVTLTVTEKGYRRGAAGGLDLTDPAVSEDLASADPLTAVGRLVRGLEERAQACDAPMTVLSCDNLADNGSVLERLVDEYCQAAGKADLATWIREKVTFPSTMVDRIVPATTDADRDLGRSLTGLDDYGLVTAELFKQWVIEDRFAGDRPAWELAGAQLVDAVAPFENMKLRILNGTHSTLAYLGALRGYASIAQAVADPELNELAHRLITEDVIPVLERPIGEDLEAYGEAVIGRFANPALAHKTTQIAMDGSQKLPLRLVGTLRAHLERGTIPHHVLRGIAGWMAYVATPVARGGLVLPLDDPMAARLAELARGVTDPVGIVERLLGVEAVFGADVPQHQAVRDELVAAVRDIVAA